MIFNESESEFIDSGRSNGGRNVSAKEEIKNIIQAGSSGAAYQI